MDVVGNGINLCFGQHSGYGGYGNWIRGSRQVLDYGGDAAAEVRWIRGFGWRTTTWWGGWG